MEYFVFHFEKFLLVFARIMGLFFTVSFFSSDALPETIRLGLIFLVTAAIYPLVSAFVPEPSPNMIEYGLSALGEGIIGMALGMIMSVYFTVFQLARQFFSVQMGFGASEVFDPLSQISLPIMGQFLYMIFTLVFMLGNGPAYILNGLFESFSRVNFADLLRTSMTGSNYGLLAAMGDLFIVALKISFPILAMLLFVSVTQGLLAKASPQMNLQSVGFQISIFVGFLILMMVTPALVNIIGNIVEYTFGNVLNLMAEMGNG
jgi:flagellar biosynthetic protein FliR